MVPIYKIFNIIHWSNKIRHTNWFQKFFPVEIQYLYIIQYYIFSIFNITLKVCYKYRIFMYIYILLIFYIFLKLIDNLKQFYRFKAHSVTFFDFLNSIWVRKSIEKHFPKQNMKSMENRSNLQAFSLCVFVNNRNGFTIFWRYLSARRACSCMSTACGFICLFVCCECNDIRVASTLIPHYAAVGHHNDDQQSPYSPSPLPPSLPSALTARRRCGFPTV